MRLVPLNGRYVEGQGVFLEGSLRGSLLSEFTLSILAPGIAKVLDPSGAITTTLVTDDFAVTRYSSSPLSPDLTRYEYGAEDDESQQSISRRARLNLGRRQGPPRGYPELEACAKQCVGKGPWRDVAFCIAKCMGKKGRDVGFDELLCYVLPEFCVDGKPPCSVKNPDTDFKQRCCDQRYVRCLATTPPSGWSRCLAERNACYIRAAVEDVAQ